MKATTIEKDSKATEWKRTRSTVARDFYNDMKSRGYSAPQILELSSELLGLVTGDIRSRPTMTKHG